MPGDEPARLQTPRRHGRRSGSFCFFLAERNGHRRGRIKAMRREFTSDVRRTTEGRRLPNGSAVDHLVRTWDGAVDRLLHGDVTLPSDLAEWSKGYLGGGE